MLVSDGLGEVGTAVDDPAFDSAVLVGFGGE